MESYIVRIYRRNGGIHGLVENLSDDHKLFSSKQFHSIKELWHVLQTNDVSENKAENIDQST